MSSGLVPVPKRTLTSMHYDDLADVPPEVEWLANITNKKDRTSGGMPIGRLRLA